MNMLIRFRTTLVALLVLLGTCSQSIADSGYVRLTIYKAGWVIGGSGGGGTLNFRGRTYDLTTGGLDYGFVFGGSKTVLRGKVHNIRRPPLTSKAFTPLAVQGLLLELAREPSFSLIRKAPFWN